MLTLWQVLVLEMFVLASSKIHLITKHISIEPDLKVSFTFETWFLNKTNFGLYFQAVSMMVVLLSSEILPLF